MSHTRRNVLRSIGAGTAALGATGVATAKPFEDGSDGTASVRVLHASPDAPAVDVFVNGDAVLTGVPFKTISGYLDVPPGEYDIAVAPEGAGIDSAVIEATLPLEAGTDYTVAAVNRLADIQAQVFVDDNDVGFPATKPRVRAVHLSPDAPAVDIAVTDGPGIEDPAVVVKGLNYRNATGYLELLPTDYSFEIRAAGSDTGVFEFDAPLEPGATYTAFAVGLLESESDDQAFDVVLSQDVAPLPDRAKSRGRAVGR
jgi:hypothetical protein